LHDTTGIGARGAGHSSWDDGAACSPIDERAVDGVSTLPRLAAIEVADDVDVEHLLDELVRTLRAAGARLAGFTQRTLASGDVNGSYLALVDLASGSQTPLSAPWGAASHGSHRACTVDHSVLATFFARTVRDMEAGVDLLILNRFGRRECEGGGCRAELAAALERDVPTLCVVRSSHADGWRAFGGDLVCCLAPDLDVVHAWYLGCRAHRRVSGDAA